MKIRTRFVISILSVLIVSALALTIMASILIGENAKKQAMNEIDSVALATAFRIQAQIMPALSASRSAAEVFTNRNDIPLSMRRSFMSSLLKSILEANPSFLSVWTVWEPGAADGMDASYADKDSHDKTGRFITAWERSGGEIGRNARDYTSETQRSLYTALKETRTETVSEPYWYAYGRGDAELPVFVASVVSPIVDEKGDFAGIVGTDIPLSICQNIIKTVTPYTEGYAFLLSNAAVRGAHPKDDYLGKPYAQDNNLDEKRLAEVLDSIKTGKPYSLTKKNIVNGQVSYMSFSPIQFEGTETPWSLVVSISMERVTEHAMENIHFLPIILVAVLLLAIPLAFLQARALSRPLSRIQGILTSIAETNDLTIEIPKRSNDEIGAMAESLAVFIAAISGLIAQFMKEAEQLHASSMDLSANMEECAAAVEEISANMESSKRQVANQTGETGECLESVRKLVQVQKRMQEDIERQSDTIDRSSRSITDLTDRIEGSAAEINTIGQKFTRLGTVSGEGREKIDLVVSQIENISKQSENLLEANSIITSIAARTNLLAMNAAIEAAHAGEAGKGFAVVADEIRKLAESSSEQAKKVAQELKSVKEGIDSIVRSSREAGVSFEEVLSSIQEVAEVQKKIGADISSQNESSKALSSALTDIDTVTAKVTDGLKTMFEQNNILLRGMEGLAALSLEIKGSIEEISAGSAQISASVQSIADLGIRNMESSDSLTKGMKRFKIKGEA